MKQSFKNAKKRRQRGAVYYISLVIFVVSMGSFVAYGAGYLRDVKKNEQISQHYREMREQYGGREHTAPEEITRIPLPTDTPTPTPEPVNTDPGNEDLPPLPNGDATPTPTPTPLPTGTPTPTPLPPVMTKYGAYMMLENADYVGDLEIVNTDPLIAYPVVKEKAGDPDYYLNHDFNGGNSKNVDGSPGAGTLFIPLECEVGVGTLKDGYWGGMNPTTNIIIFGHNRISNHMFGNLDRYADQKFYETHKYIYFDTAYENRTYEVIAAFYSHEFADPNDDNFKYYFFYNADTEDEFDYWYKNVKAASKINCNGTGRYGDQFLTLSTCAKIDETGAKNENGRFAVVAVRIQ